MDKGRSECLKNEQMDSLVEAFVGLRHYLFNLKKIFLAVWHVGSQFHDWRWNQCPQHWKLRVLATGPPGKPCAFSSLVSATPGPLLSCPLLSAWSCFLLLLGFVWLCISKLQKPQPFRGHNQPQEFLEVLSPQSPLIISRALSHSQQNEGLYSVSGSTLFFVCDCIEYITHSFML